MKKSIENVSPTALKKMYVDMLKIRRFEESVGDLVSRKEIKTPCHLYIGQEAVAVGVCSVLKKGDYVFGTHRSHGHYIAKGGDIKELMAELYGKITGCSKGKGGSMHLACVDRGLMGSSSMVAGTIPLAVGAGLAFLLQRKDNVSVAFFGDGATHEGVFYESLNFASLKKLAVIFICENNLYSTHMPIAKSLADTRIYKKAEVFNLPGFRIDGNNVMEVFQTVKEAIKRAREGEGPTLLECMTYRWCGHVGFSDDLDKGLRSKEELDYWEARCPIKRLEKILMKRNILSEAKKNKIAKRIEEETEEAIKFAKKSHLPDKSELKKDIFK